MLIQSNLKAACTLLNFPSLARFIEERKTRQYDVIGISSIMTNLQKAGKMCRMVELMSTLETNLKVKSFFTGF